MIRIDMTINGKPYHRYMLVRVTEHAEWILTINTISLYSMHDNYHMTPKDITREGW